MHSEQRSAEFEPGAAPAEQVRQGEVTNFPRSAKTRVAARRGKPRRQAVLVLGMHRSGTSAVTEALGFLGGRLPARILPPQPDNPRGFFEPQGIVEIHERLLASAGTSWFDWDAFPTNWYAALEAHSYVRELAEAIRADYGNAGILLLKDPRICRFLPLWTRLLSELKIQPLVVLPFRNPLEVAASLRHRNGFSLAHVHLLWLRHVLDAEFGSRDFHRTFMRYEDFIMEPRGAIDRLEKQIPVVWPRKSARAYREIENAVEIDFRHHVAAANDLVARSDVLAWIREAYEAYEKLCGDPLDQQALRTLDRVRSRFDEACEAFAPALQGLQIQVEEQSNELRLVRQELAGAQQRGAELEALAADIQHVYDETQAALASESDRGNRAEAAMSRLPELELEIDAARRAKEQLAVQVAELAPVVTRAHELELALGREREVAARVPTLEEALGAAQDELDKAREASAKHAAEAARLTERMRLIEKALHALDAHEHQSGNTIRYLYWAITFQLFGRCRAEQRLKTRMRMVARSGLLDPDWYLQAYPDVAADGIDPLRHYCESGFLENRRPGPNADDASAGALARQMEAI